MQCRFLFLLLLISTSALWGQGVVFSEVSLETAITLAKEQDKKIFIDTYASYCKPCKKLNIEFKNKALAKYLNQNYIRVKVNMESEKAEDYKNKYSIVFLPTMLFLDPYGNVNMTIDHMLSANEILAIAKHLNGDNKKPAVVAASPPPTTQKAPAAHNTPPTAQPKTAPSVATVVTDESEGKILYVMGQEGGELPPEILREEAYFRMQLMDGSHHAASTKYLETQEDWSTDVNIKFIHDFLNDARSDKFEYLIANRSAFEALLGKPRIAQSIKILVNKELERAFPRPDKERVALLTSYLN